MNSLSSRRFEVLAGLMLGALAAHCSSPADPATPGSTGGAPTNTGGTAATGGTNPTGGSAPTVTGGTTFTGGVANGTGGTATGGATTGGSANGGASTGGSANTGGSGGSSKGGSNTGGTSATGGSAGASTTGGSSGGKSTGGSGGKSTSGGTTSTGGNATGGSATGGAGGSVGNFSAFITSFAAIKRLSGKADGFGGDLRYGQANGLDGADKICKEIAETAMPGAGSKTWRAFLSVKGPPVVNAIDRVGDGPWYDRKGRILAMTKAALAMQRPQGADPAIINDFPNEDGVPNHNPDGTGNVDNHDTLTGSTTTGTLYMTGNPTCNDWTSSEPVANMKPRVGHSWPAQSGMNWMSALDEGGCGAGVNLVEMGPPQQGVYTVGTGGGYGGFYCFALTP